MSSDTQNLFLGLDLSTQGLKAVIISEENQVVHESAVNFDRELPHFGTTNGAVQGPDEGEVTSPVKMWLEAFDLITQKMKDAGVNLSRIMGISGDGQVRFMPRPICVLPFYSRLRLRYSNTVPSTGLLMQSAFCPTSTRPRASPSNSHQPLSLSSAALSGKTLLPLASARSSRRPSAVPRFSLTSPVAAPMSDSLVTRSVG